MGFLIDTDIWVAVERGALSPADICAVTGTELVFLSPVNLAELQMGMKGSVQQNVMFPPHPTLPIEGADSSWWVRDGVGSTSKCPHF